MVNVVARIKIKGKNFEVLVDCDKAIELKKQKNLSAGTVRDILAIDTAFSDYKKGLKVSSADLTSSFGSDDIYEVTVRILKDGEILLPQEYREKERELKVKQVVEFLVKNCIDPRTDAPYTAERINNAIKEAGARIDEHKRAEDQALVIIKDLAKVIPIKISTIKLKVTVPAAHVGHAYSIFANLEKDKEEWLSDGSLVAIIHLPAGMQLDFYDKLNSITHGSALTEQIKE